jgi:glycosyltransferase involved in cell wall biosynthesis
MIHERFPQYFNKPNDRRFITLKRRAFQNATHIIAISESTKQDVTEFCNIPPEKISVVHLGIEPRFRPVQDSDALRSFRKRYSLGEPYLLFVGTRQYYKNFTALLKAFFLSGLDRDFLLVAFGSEPVWTEEEAEVLRTQGRGRENRVRLGGYLKEDELPLAYSGASCLIYPSLYEGFGLPILEAMACGTPVICSSSASLPEVGGNAPMYFEGKSIESLIEALRSLLVQDLRERVRQGIEWVRSFTWEKTARLTRQVYEEVSG